MDPTAKDRIRGWLAEAKQKGATHVIVACDTYNYSEFPVFVMQGEDVREKAKENNSSAKMLKLIGVYSMNRNIEEQLAEDHAFHYD